MNGQNWSLEKDKKDRGEGEGLINKSRAIIQLSIQINYINSNLSKYSTAHQFVTVSLSVAHNRVEGGGHALQSVDDKIRL